MIIKCHHRLCFIILLSLLFSVPALIAGQKLDRRVKPGGRIVEKFPNMGKTLHNEVAQLTIWLPTDYDIKKKHPVFLWMGGGTGGKGGNPNLVNKSHYICIGMPLFKKNADKYTGDKKILIMKEDVPLIWKNYQVMLKKLHELVPNIDKSTSVSGGFSNGGHCASLLISYTKGAYAENFPLALFVEGGSYLENAKSIKGGAMMVLAGETSLGKGFLHQMRKKAKSKKIHFTGVLMKKVGHAFDKKYEPQVSEWLLKTLPQSLIPKQLIQVKKLISKKQYASAIASLKGLQAQAEGSVHAKKVNLELSKLEKRASSILKSKQIQLKSRKLKNDKKIQILDQFIEQWQGSEAAKKAEGLKTQLQGKTSPANA